MAHRGREPRSCRSAKRAVPRGLEKAEGTRPPVPIRLCADNCTGPWESPKQAKQGDSERGLLSFFHSLSKTSLMALDKVQWTETLDTITSLLGLHLAKNWLAGNSKPGFRWGCHAHLCNSGDLGWSLYLLIVSISKEGPMEKHSRHADACWTYFTDTTPLHYITFTLPLQPDPHQVTVGQKSSRISKCLLCPRVRPIDKTTCLTTEC